jgi:hypothetical protein
MEDLEQTTPRGQSFDDPIEPFQIRPTPMVMDNRKAKPM